LGGKRQIAGTNRGHVGLLSSRAEIFKVDVVWTQLACILHRKVIEERASLVAANGPVCCDFSLDLNIPDWRA
jgi:hypothetical protein